ncbi:MAG: DNA polymerase III subunit beta [Myxococcales bacterium]|nr:DNA polymerase III subunit beta [Myxococcales bacterium]
MEIKIEKNAFLAGLALAQGVADRKSTMPILANVLLRTDGRDKVFLAATDLNVTVTAELPAKVEKEGGLTLGAKQLHDIVKQLPGEELSLKRGENHYAEIKAGKVDYRMVGMADRDYPKVPNHREVTFSKVDAGILRDLIAKTFFSISSDETRYHLNGVLFECDGKGDKARARMVSTDGHRLSKIERPLPGGPEIPQGVIIPRKGLMEIRRVLEGVSGEIELGFQQGHAFVRNGRIAVSVKLIEAQFPPFEQVIPKEHDKLCGLDRIAFLEALKRISLMSSDKTWGIKFTLEKGLLRVASDNPDLGDGREELDADYDGPALTVGFNARYFIDVLGEIETQRVRLELGNELDPGVVRPIDGGDYLGVIMPMRI